MTTRERTSPQIRPYLDVLETRIGGLPSDERTELLNDLEDHLEEILSDEPDTPLSDRIGLPDGYATEFLASVGITGDSGRNGALADIVADRIHRLGEWAATSNASELWEEMRPAWWTIRGLAIGLLLTWNYLWPGNPDFPWILIIAATVMLPVFVWASMRLGRNRKSSAGWKWVSIVVTVAGTIAIFALAANVSARLDPNTYESGQYPVHMEEDSYRYGSLTEQDFLFMTKAGMTPEEYFDSGYYQDVRESGFVPPLTTDPSEPPVIVTP